MDYDEQARSEFIDGQNDAIDLLSPQSDSYYYLEGWHDAKRRLADGELCWVYPKHRQPVINTNDDWEVF